MEKYYEDLKTKLERYYDIEEEFKINNYNFDFLAKFNQKSSKYLLVKELEYYSFKNDEYIFMQDNVEDINFEMIDKILDENLDEILEIDKDHMSSVITFLFSTESNIKKEDIKKIEKYKFYKSFKFGFNGWVNVRIIVINPNEKNGISNKFGRKEVKKFLAS